MEYTPNAEEKKDEGAPEPAFRKSGEYKIPDKGYTNRLEGKLREQAGKLHELESYKLLCERRILELSPGHPLPLKNSHLGKPAPKDSRTFSSQASSKLELQIQLKGKELHSLQQKIDKISAENKQLKLAISKKVGSEQTAEGELAARFEELEKEKSTLEESLRGEMLVSEEQRNYIEILKEALEAKIEDLGLVELLKQARGGEGKDSCDVFAKLTVMKKELDEKRKEVAKGESDVADMEGLIADLKKQTDEQREQLSQLHFNYSKAIKDKDDAAKLLEELNQKVRKLN